MTSPTSWAHTVASMVTAIDGIPDRRRYRRFRIRTVTNDDPHAMAQTIKDALNARILNPE